MWGRFSTREKFNYWRHWFPWKRRRSQKENFKNLKPLTGKAHHFFFEKFMNHNTSSKISSEILGIFEIFTPYLMNSQKLDFFRDF